MTGPRRAAATYLRSARTLDRAIAGVRSVFTGLWLGVLSDDDLDAVDDAYYLRTVGWPAGPIDYTSGRYNRQGLFDWERRAIETHFPNGGLLAVVAAGGGREVLALRRAGYAVDGWECQPSFVAAANALLVAEGFEPSVAQVPRNVVPEGRRCFDGAIVGWGAYSLVRGRQRRVALLRQLRQRVGDDAPVLLSFFARRAGDRRYRIVVRAAGLAGRFRGGGRAELGDILDPNHLHAFVEEELAAELADAGFQLQSFATTPYGHAVARAVPTGPTPTGQDTGPDPGPTIGGDPPAG